jgi:Starch-binding associating with outer membrane/Susd and RagB outer membrane lipoprotein
MNTSKKAVAVLALVLLTGWGCSDFLNGPGLTENPNNPTAATPLQILISVQSSAATRLEGQVARCAAIFVQQLIGSNNQQLTFCTGYGVQEGDISGAMAGFYTGGGLLGLRTIEASAQASGDNVMLGIAKVWEGYQMGTAASVWGDLPYSEAVTPGIDSPKLDTQHQIYDAVQTVLSDGITALTTAAATASGNCAPSEGDLIYCATAVPRATQLARWIRAAHTLKARFHLHLVERLGVAEYTSALNEALLGINEVPTTQQQAIHGQAPGDFRFFHGSVQDFDANIWGEFLLSRQDVVAGDAMIEIMKARNDTVRMRNYFDPDAQGAFVGANQDNVTVKGTCVGTCAPSVINTSVRRVFTFRQPMITWAENQLILAEARYMTGDSLTGATNVNAVRTAVGLPVLAAPTFVDVMTEKYIAMYQNIEAWSDYKRTCIPVLTPHTGATEVLGRLPYGSAERNANANIPLPSAYPTGTTGSSAVRNWDDPNPC